jgi:hypothetical protein
VRVRVGIHRFTLLARFITLNFQFFSVLIPGLHIDCHNIYCTFFCYLPFTSPDLRQIHSYNYTDIGCPDLPKDPPSHMRTERDPVSETLGSFEYRTKDDVQNVGNPELLNNVTCIARQRRDINLLA